MAKTCFGSSVWALIRSWKASENVRARQPGPLKRNTFFWGTSTVALRGLELGYMGLFCFFGWGRFASLPMSLFTTPMAHGPSTSKRSFCLKKEGWSVHPQHSASSCSQSYIIPSLCSCIPIEHIWTWWFPKSKQPYKRWNKRRANIPLIQGSRNLVIPWPYFEELVKQQHCLQ